MANIVILGDTWGIVPVHTWGFDKDIVEWFEYQFLKKGHPTFNKAWGGNSNNHQLNQLEVLLSATKDTPMAPDIIIWFHSELMRDIPQSGEFNGKSFATEGYDGMLEFAADNIYGWASRLKQEFPSTKWAIMGGHAPLLPTKTHLLDWADFKIENLRSKIAGVDIPVSHAFEFLELGKGSLWDFPDIPEDIIQRELAIKEQIISATQDTTKFYNQKHPALGPMKALAAEIITHFNL